VKTRWTRGALALALTAAALLLAVAAAGAANPPRITDGPTIEGTPQVGAELQARGSWSGGPPPEPSWTWLRCPRAGGPCAAIPGATSDRYRVVAADAGSMLRVGLVVTNKGGSDQAQSAPTAPVPGASAPTVTPTPPPAATPAPTPAPTFDVPGPVVTPTPPPVTPVTSAAPRPALLKPFPVVRIKGALTWLGARVTLLSVRAPRGVRIVVACRGRDCPARRYRAPRGTHRLRRFERNLRAGTRLEIRITKVGYIGKRTLIVIRRGQPPSRSDRCVEPGGRVLRCAGL